MKKRPVHSRGSLVRTACAVGHDPRAPAAPELAATLQRSRIHGVTTNRDLLVATLLHPEVLAGTADTGFYDAHGPAELTAGNGLSVGYRVGREGLEAETLPEG